VFGKRKKELQETGRTVADRENSRDLRISGRDVLGKRKTKEVEDIEWTRDEETRPGPGEARTMGSDYEPCHSSKKRLHCVPCSECLCHQADQTGGRLRLQEL